MALTIDPKFIHIHDLLSVGDRWKFFVDVKQANGVHYVANGILVDYDVLRQEIAKLINQALVENHPPAGLLHGIIKNKNYVTHNIIHSDHDIFKNNGVNPIRRRDDDNLILWGMAFIYNQEMYSIIMRKPLSLDKPVVHPYFRIFCIVEEAQETITENILLPTTDEVGEFIDDKAAGYVYRSAPAVAGRVLEEMIELCLAVGLAPGAILNHVTDALANQALKLSNKLGYTILPSELIDNIDNEFDRDVAIAGEIADVRLTLKDLIYVLGFIPELMDQAETQKWQAFTKKEFRVSAKGCLYSVAAHIKTVKNK